MGNRDGRLIMRGLFENVLIAAGLFIPACSGQAILDEVNFRSGQIGGLHLLGLSVYSGYSTTAYPQTGFALNASTGVGNLGADVNYGASASLGWQHHREKTDVSVMYTGTYGGMVRYSGLNAYSQSLSVAASRTLTPRWTVNFSAAGQYATLAQYLYQPSPL